MATFLVVDDDRLFRWAVKETLQREGYAVVEAENGREAVQLLATTIDFAVLDYRLPDTTGGVLSARILEIHSNCTIIVWTSEPNDEGCEEATRNGARAYLAKPNDTGKIVEIVQTLLDAE